MKLNTSAALDKHQFLPSYLCQVFSSCSYYPMKTLSSPWWGSTVTWDYHPHLLLQYLFSNIVRFKNVVTDHCLSDSCMLSDNVIITGSDTQRLVFSGDWSWMRCVILCHMVSHCVGSQACPYHQWSLIVLSSVHWLSSTKHNLALITLILHHFEKLN